MAVTREAELFAREGSVLAEPIVAMLVFGPPDCGWTVTVMVAVALLARLGMVQVTIPLFCETVPNGLLAVM